MIQPKRRQSRPFQNKELPKGWDAVPVPTVALLEHLQEVFPPQTAKEMLSHTDPAQIALNVAEQAGVESVIGYIEELINRERR